MITLYLAAGKSARFRAAGFAMPKPLLPMPDGRKLINWSMGFLRPEQLIVVGHESDQKILFNALDHRFLSVWLKDYSDGPLSSAAYARKWLFKRDELIIAYCDIVLLGQEYNRFLTMARAQNAPSAIITFESDNPRFGRTEQGACISGIFYFRSAVDFALRAKRNPGPEQSIYTAMKAGETYHYPAREDNLLDLGTPEDYQRFMASYDYYHRSQHRLSTSAVQEV